MAFITSAELKTALANMLAQAEVDVATRYGNIIANSVAAAYGDICRILIGVRLLTKAQVDTWVDGPTFNRDIGLWWALIKGAGLDKVDKSALLYLDRRKELETAILLDSNYEIIEVDTDTTSGVVGYGTLTTDTDLNVPDSQDVRRGSEPTRW